MANPDEILAFWLDEIGPKGWYEASDALDETIRERFLDDYNRMVAGSLSLWLTYPTGTLAYIILADQFSRKPVIKNHFIFKFIDFAQIMNKGADKQQVTVQKRIVTGKHIGQRHHAQRVVE